jgi:hypothetical protein
VGDYAPGIPPDIGAFWSVAGVVALSKLAAWLVVSR